MGPLILDRSSGINLGDPSLADLVLGLASFRLVSERILNVIKIQSLIFLTDIIYYSFLEARAAILMREHASDDYHSNILQGPRLNLQESLMYLCICIFVYKCRLISFRWMGAYYCARWSFHLLQVKIRHATEFNDIFGW